MLYELARRADAAAWTDLFDTSAARDAGLTARSLAGGVCLCAPGLDHLLLNRALDVPPDAWDAAVRSFRDQSVARFMLHVPEDALLAAEAPARALELEAFHRPWAKLGRSAGAVDVPRVDVTVRPARAGEAHAVGALYAAGFDVPAPAAPVFAAMVDRPGWDVLVAIDDGEIVGLGVAFDTSGGTTLMGGVTRPSHRGRGIQRALMAHRIARAFDRGAAWITSETGVAVPGEPNSSWHNMERCGLRQVGLQHHFVPIGARWGAQGS